MAEAALFQQLADLPKDENPYTFLADRLISQIFPTLAESTINQLYFLAALLGIIGLLALASLAIRISKRICWVVRYDSKLRLVQPHASIPWTIGSLVDVALLEVLIVRYLKLFRGHPQLDTGYWLFTVWSSIWIAGSLAIWSIAASLVVHRSAVGHNIKHSAMVVNVLGMGTPLAVLAVALPIGILGGRSYERVMISTRTIVHSLRAKGQAWSPGDSFSLASLASDAPAFQKLVKDIDDLGSFARSTYLFYSVAALALLVALLSVGSYYILTLRRLLTRSTTSFDPGFTQSPAHKRVKRTLDSLIMILFAFSLLAGGCFAVSVYGAINPLLLNNTSASTAVSVAPIWLFGVLGLPCAILLVRGAWTARESDKQIVESLSKQDRERESSSRRKTEAKPMSKTLRSGLGLGRWRDDDEDLTTESGLNTVVVTIDVQVQVDEDVELSEKGSSFGRSKSDLF